MKRINWRIIGWIILIVLLGIGIYIDFFNGAEKVASILQTIFK